MTQRWPSDTNEDGGLNWPRIAGMTFVIAVHAAALLLLLAPVTPPPPKEEPPKQIKLTPTPQPPQPTPTPPQEQPPVVFDTPAPMDVAAPPPSPPAPPPPAPGPRTNPSDLRASLCSKPSDTPLALAIRKAQQGGTAVIQLQYSADGSVTSATLSKSSRNRDLDRAALSWAKQVRLCPGAAGSGLLPIVMNLGE